MPRQRGNAPGPAPGGEVLMQESTYPGKRIKTRYPGIYYRESRDGKRTYLIVYRDSDGKQRSRNVPGGLRAAQAALDDVKGRSRRGERTAPSRVRLRDFGDEWLNEAGGRVRRTTRQVYHHHLDNHIY